MFENDFLMRQIELITRGLSVLFLGKDLPHNIILEEVRCEEGIVVSEEYLLLSILKKRIGEGDINGAENMLFSYIYENSSKLNLEIGILFYDELNKMDDKMLKLYDFSRKEILDGLSEIKKIYKQQPTTISADFLIGK